MRRIYIRSNCTQPDDYYLTKAKYTGEIVQVLEGDDYVELRVNITKGTYSYSDTIYVIYSVGDDYSRLLEDDIVDIYGYNMGLTSYTSIFGATITLPLVYAQYIDLVG